MADEGCVHTMLYEEPLEDNENYRTIYCSFRSQKNVDFYAKSKINIL